MQEWARHVCVSKKFSNLFVPNAWGVEKFQYKMDRIDVSRPLLLTDVKGHPVLSELKTFYAVAKDCSVYPADYELYIQGDGRVAMVDFDKFGTWLKDGRVEYPWGLTLTASHIEDTLKILLGE